MKTTCRYRSITQCPLGYVLSSPLPCADPVILPGDHRAHPLNRVNLGNLRVRFEKTKPILTTA
jgi:hypothetical protein